MQSKPKFQNSPWATFNQSDWRISITWPELTNQRRVFCAFAVFCAQRARRKIFVPWLGNFGHVTWAKKKKGIVLISKSFLPSLSHSFSSPLVTPLLYFPWYFIYLFFHFIAFTYLCCLDSIFIALAMSLVMIISLPIFSIFLSTLTFCSLDYVQCTGLCRYLCICILTLTFLFYLNRSWVVPSVMRTKDVWRTTTCVSREVSSIGFALSFPGFEPVNTPTTVQRTYHLLSFVWVEPAVSCFVVQRTTNRFFFLHIFFDLNQRPLPPKPSTLLTVLARLRWWCEE